MSNNPRRPNCQIIIHAGYIALNLAIFGPVAFIIRALIEVILFKVQKGKTYKQCADCRSRQLAYKQHGKMGVSSKGFKLRETPIGNAPVFLAEGHREMWQEWLRGLVGQVERCPIQK